MTNTKHGIWIAAAAVLQCTIGLLALSGSTNLAFSQAVSPYLPTADAGRAIALKLCSACHLTPEAPARPVTVGIPSLAALANKPEQTPEAIALRLINPPHAMPDMQLTRDEIGDVIAYLATLRTSPAAPPWPARPTRPTDGEGPKYPRPT